MGFDKNGSQIQKSVYGKSHQEVKNKLRKILEEVGNGNYSEPSKKAMNELLDMWLDSLHKTNILKPTTYGAYEQNVRVHIKPGIGDVLLKDLDADKIENFYSEKLKNGRFDGLGGLSTATMIKIHNLLHQCLEYAISRKLITSSPLKDVKPPKLVEKPIRNLTKKEQETFQNMLTGERLKAAFLLDLASGLRLGELLALTWDDLNIKEKYLTVNKTLVRIRLKNQSDGKKSKLIVQSPKTETSNRIVPILDDIIPILEVHKSKQLEEIEKSEQNYVEKNLVFCTEDGNHIEPRNMMRIFYRLIEKAKIPHSNFHALRHAFSTRLLEAGISEKIVQELLSHSSPIQTSKYMHVFDDTKRKSISKINHLFKTKDDDQDQK